MKYAISNIAWNEEHNASVIALMHEYLFNAVEIAPSKIWSIPLDASKRDIIACRRYWENNGIEIVAMQALLFDHPELTIFETNKQRAKTIGYLKRIIDIANGLGVQALVFGSPKNRYTNKLPTELINDIATEFFFTLGEYAASQNTCLCIEPNPIEYGCDFVNNSIEASKLVQQVNSPGFGLHLDIAALQMSNENIADVISQQANYAKHIHISEPFLSTLGKGDIDHAKVGNIIMNSDYDKCLSIEMRASEGNIIESIESSLALVQKHYQ